MKRGIIFVFGVLPALALLWLSAPGLVLGLALFWPGQGSWLGLGIVFWAVAGMWGAMSLILAAAGRTNKVVILGLIIGMIAVIPLIVGLMVDPPEGMALLVLLITGGPFLVAGYLVTEAVGRRSTPL